MSAYVAVTPSPLSRIPVGSTLTRRYFVAAGRWAEVDQHEDPGYAALAALDTWATEDTDGPVAPPMIDERWVMVDPSGAKHEVFISRDQVAVALTSGAFLRQADRVAAANAAGRAIRKVLREHAAADALP